MFISQWRACEIAMMNLETLRVIIALIKEHVEHTGRYPTAEQIQQQLHLMNRDG